MTEDIVPSGSMSWFAGLQLAGFEVIPEVLNTFEEHDLSDDVARCHPPRSPLPNHLRLSPVVFL